MTDTDRGAFGRNVLTYWWIVLPALASLSVSAVSIYPRVTRRPPAVTPDSALYLYVGRRMAGGALPYLTTWDVKPPAIFETTALLSILVGGDSLSMHAIGLAANAVVLSLSCVLLALIARRLTANRIAALAAGLTPLAYPYTYLYAAHGVRAIYFLCVFGLATIYFYLDDRVILSTASGALAAAYWHFGLLFPLATLGAYWYRALRSPENGRDRSANRTGPHEGWLSLGTLLAVTLLVCAPFVLGGALGPLLIQTVVVHVVAAERIFPLGNLRVYLSLFGLLSVVGAYGAGIVSWHLLRSSRSVRSIRSVLPGAIRSDEREREARADGENGAAVRAEDGGRVENERNVSAGLWWVPVTIGWFLLQVLGLDMDGPPDFVPLTVFAGLGVACFVAAFAPDSRSVFDRAVGREGRSSAESRVVATARRNEVRILGLVAIAVGISVAWLLVADPPFPPATGRVPRLFLSGGVSPSCHVRFTEAERLWLARTPANRGDAVCLGGDLGTVLELLRAHL